jgi:glutamate--cysteine ligase
MADSTSVLSTKLRYLIDNHQQHLLCNGLKGLEKESLRISKQGIIATTPHPTSLGSALTHLAITTDYSEALLEFITEPFADTKQLLHSMENIHQFAYQQLDNEILLASSMPCGIDGDQSIPIAEYGRSNIGKMKYIYRQGLSHRYGRTMQAISGIHFNYSVPKSLWPILKQQSDHSTDTLNDFIAESYFGLIRNFQRKSWLILYLFGASPAICKRFLNSRPHLMAPFETFDSQTLYRPYATSLRMSEIGYTSTSQANLNIDYNSLNGYVKTLTQAINTPYPEYEKIGVNVEGHYKQLNAHILQIENELYSTVRPKQIIDANEKPSLALKRRGVEYIEIRSLDVDLLNPIGIDEPKARFMEAFLLHCLLEDSPLQSQQAQQINNDNHLIVAHQGRQPDISLNQHGKMIPLPQWATDILQAMQPICEILDQNITGKPYSTSLQLQQQCVDDASLTPSAKILDHLRQQQQSFSRFSIEVSNQYADYFKSKPPLADAIEQHFKQMVTSSHQQQQQIEAEDCLNFDDFLANYFKQHE